MSHPSVRSSVATLVTTGALAAALTACSGSGSSSSGPTDTASSGTHTIGSRIANVVVTAAKGCVADHATYQAGALTFKVRNFDATAVSEVEVLSGERIVGEKENLPPGFAGQFAADLNAGTYQLYCPGATPERTTFTVTGKSRGTSDSTVAALLQAGTKGYANYVDTQVAALVSATTKFNETLKGTDLKAAQNAYMQARPYYEKIEPVAESFLSLDTVIDARADNVPASQFQGFHRIEQGLFQDKSLKGMAAFGDTLLANVKSLKVKTAGLSYQPTELANGAQGLLDEVSANKITGEEERYSHIDLLDFANNDEGAEQAFAQLQPALMKIDPVLTRTISTRFTALDKLVDTYRTTSNDSGYELYTTLTATDKRQLAAAVKAVQEPLSKVASKVANA